MPLFYLITLLLYRKTIKKIDEIEKTKPQYLKISLIERFIKSNCNGIKVKMQKYKLTSFKDQITEYIQIIEESEMFKHLVCELKERFTHIEKIRCLAIGSFAEDFQARYQIAFLIKLVEVLSKDKHEHIVVSINDPVFTEEDMQYIHDLGDSWKVEPDLQQIERSTNKTLFFLPHAPLELTESVLMTEKPQIFLANNLVRHTDRYTKIKLFEKYPVMSKLVNYLEKNEVSMKNNEIAKNDEDFQIVKKKKRRGKNIIYKEAQVDYDSIETYFETAEIISDFKNGKLLENQPWINSFSDLTLHLIL
ncbi:hypothetical protein TBLA_0C02120 [Henningerozyma blattae CBS 6284]|uniref:SRR1-like domain-containing protein n=1 Tax=Henningerozyma blattae (strain ATCC 34711 / CBS 6284 / DSM 70876 / NBRC 10599 / NRRL Y-10934 / UCD 77-7) TaxID=1071380 RepID=I2H0X2_HENB6|nr:hypothetical protein TBLA_0C02120 [Tetrapisispora blattae CBS 6284]CCH60024.1 hypothetical protein TBLA_0C02120 [Tetrapisispora blattae CBS 6284]